jgi:hypothetical protein
MRNVGPTCDQVYRLASQGFTTSAVRSAKCLTFLVLFISLDNGLDVPRP